MKVLVLCRTPNCRQNPANNSDPTPMRMTQEYHSAWTFKCDACGWVRAWTKDQVGGELGVGKRDDGSGPTGGKGPSRWRQGVNFQ
jgi:hypothetical protein